MLIISNLYVYDSILGFTIILIHISAPTPKSGADIHAKNEFIRVIMLISLLNFHANP